MDARDRPRYMISVAAELVGMHPQTLRIYEQKGLVRPQRTAGNTRLYSDADVERLRLIQRLTGEWGLNLAGVERVLHMEDELERLRRRMAGAARGRRAQARIAAERARWTAAAGDLVRVLADARRRRQGACASRRRLRLDRAPVPRARARAAPRDRGVDRARARRPAGHLAGSG